jgi:hypothetical protein
VIAFLYQAAVVGSLIAAPVFVLAALALEADQAGIAFLVAMLATGPVAAYFTFRKRWRVIEAFSSRFCIGLMNLSILYVPVVAFIYANVRGVQKLTGR